MNEVQVRFIQHMLPNGRKETVFIDRTKEIAEKAKTLWDNGYELHCEMLRDMVTISFSIEKPSTGDIEDVIINRLVRNGPKVPVTVDHCIETAFEHFEKNKQAT